MTVDAVVGRLLDRFGPTRLERLAEQLSDERPMSTLVGDDGPDLRAAAAGLSSGELAALLRGAAAGYRHRDNREKIELVWTGPSVHGVPVRSTAAVLTGLVLRAQHSLDLMTYAAYRYEPLLAALRDAVDRGVAVSVIVETAEANPGFRGDSAAAFAEVAGIHLWHWPAPKRGPRRSSLHAKVAVADQREVLIGSANLTGAGAEVNIEAGVLIAGGEVPKRTAEHIRALKESGQLVRLR